VEFIFLDKTLGAWMIPPLPPEFFSRPTTINPTFTKMIYDFSDRTFDSGVVDPNRSSGFASRNIIHLIGSSANGAINDPQEWGATATGTERYRYVSIISLQRILDLNGGPNPSLDTKNKDLLLQRAIVHELGHQFHSPSCITGGHDDTRKAANPQSTTYVCVMNHATVAKPDMAAAYGSHPGFCVNELTLGDPTCPAPGPGEVRQGPARGTFDPL
jgi:hypothetical protein